MPRNVIGNVGLVGRVGGVLNAVISGPSSASVKSGHKAYPAAEVCGPRFAARAINRWTVSKSNKVVFSMTAVINAPDRSDRTQSGRLILASTAGIEVEKGLGSEG